MDIRFFLQGLHKDDDQFAALKSLVSIPDLKRCIIGTAFINVVGVNLFIDDLSKIKDKLTLYIGIRNGITSKQAIAQLLSHNIHPICIDTATQA